MCYVQKLSNDTLGIVDHSHGESTVYIFDERLGPKKVIIQSYTFLIKLQLFHHGLRESTSS